MNPTREEGDRVQMAMEKLPAASEMSYGELAQSWFELYVMQLRHFHGKYTDSTPDSPERIEEYRKGVEEWMGSRYWRAIQGTRHEATIYRNLFEIALATKAPKAEEYARNAIRAGDRHHFAVFDVVWTAWKAWGLDPEDIIASALEDGVKP